jgi:hypothetical protein
MRVESDVNCTYTFLTREKIFFLTSASIAIFAHYFQFNFS